MPAARRGLCALEASEVTGQEALAASDATVIVLLRAEAPQLLELAAHGAQGTALDRAAP